MKAITINATSLRPFMYQGTRGAIVLSSSDRQSLRNYSVNFDDLYTRQE